jgi:hypothetical protein
MVKANLFQVHLENNLGHRGVLSTTHNELRYLQCKRLETDELDVKYLNGVETSRQRIPYVGKRIGSVFKVDADSTLPVPKTLGGNGVPQSTELLRDDDGQVSDLYITEWVYPQKIRVTLEGMTVDRWDYQVAQWYDVDGYNTPDGPGTGTVANPSRIIWPDWRYGVAAQYDAMDRNDEGKLNQAHFVWWDPNVFEGSRFLNNAPLMISTIKRCSAGLYEYTGDEEFSWNKNWSQVFKIEEKWDANFNPIDTITGFDIEWIAEAPSGPMDMRIQFLNV